MGLLEWVGHNWFPFFQTAGIVGGLLFTAISLQIDAKVRKVQNLIVITGNHREIWTKLYERPELSRLLSHKIPGPPPSITPEEEIFVTLVILHLNSVYHASKRGMFIKPEGMHEDVRRFFSLPIPNAVWGKLKILQDEAFVRFVDAAIAKKTRELQ